MKLKHLLLTGLGALLYVSLTPTWAINRSDFVDHKFLATNGTVTASNKDGWLHYLKKGDTEWLYPQGDCMEGGPSTGGVKGRAYINSVRYIPETRIFVAVGFFTTSTNVTNPPSTEAHFCYSTNGIYWNGRNIPGGSGSNPSPYRYANISDIAYADGYYVIAGLTDDAAMVKAIKAQDVKNATAAWSDVLLPQGSGPVNSVVAFDTDQFIAVGNNSSVYTFSPSKSNWGVNSQPSISGASKLTQVIYVQDTSRDINKFVAIGDDAKILYLYKNDIAELTPWNLGINVTPGGPKFNQITYANPMFVAVADTNVIWQSDKGEIWYQARGLSGNDNLNQITFSDGQFKAAGANGDVWYKANPNDVNDLNWVRKKYVQIENDSVGYSIVEVCTLPNYIRDGKQTPQKKCNKTNAVPSLGKSKALPESLQPEGGFKKGDKICVNAMTTSGTDYYFQVNQDATEFNSVTLAVKGTIGNPSADSSDIAAISPIGAPKKGVSYVCASFPN